MLSGILYGILSGMCSGPGVAHSIRSWWDGVRVQTWRTASGAGDMEFGSRHGPQDAEPATWLGKTRLTSGGAGVGSRGRGWRRRRRRRSHTFVNIQRPSPARWGKKTHVACSAWFTPWLFEDIPTTTMTLPHLTGGPLTAPHRASERRRWSRTGTGRAHFRGLELAGCFAVGSSFKRSPRRFPQRFFLTEGEWGLPLLSPQLMAKGHWPTFISYITFIRHLYRSYEAMNMRFIIYIFYMILL